MVGNIVEWKGQHIFIDSYKYLKSKNVKYFIAGTYMIKNILIPFQINLITTR